MCFRRHAANPANPDDDDDGGGNLTRSHVLFHVPTLVWLTCRSLLMILGCETRCQLRCVQWTIIRALGVS